MGDKSEPTELRLPAILTADVAGYSRLMGVDEEGTLRALKQQRRAGTDHRPLIDAETRVHLWADRFEGALEDVFDLQDRKRCCRLCERE